VSTKSGHLHRVACDAFLSGNTTTQNYDGAGPGFTSTFIVPGGPTSNTMQVPLGN